MLSRQGYHVPDGFRSDYSIDVPRSRAPLTAPLTPVRRLGARSVHPLAGNELGLLRGRFALKPLVKGFPAGLAYRAMDLIASWLLHVEASGSAERTTKSYRMGLSDFAWWMDAPLDTVTSDDIRQWMVDGRRDGLAASTIRNRLTVVKIFYKWAAAERGLSDPAAGVRAPGVPQPRTEVLSAEQQRDLLAACRGKHFNQLRDTAILLVLLDGGLRAAECVSLTLGDINLAQRTLVVRGKGAQRAGERLRLVPVGARTVLALDRYLYVRKEGAALWLGNKRLPLAYEGLLRMIQRRGEGAGISGLHPHVFRHTWASEFRRAGGSEGDLMILGGWQSRGMLDRYGRADAESRALEAGRKVLTYRAG